MKPNDIITLTAFLAALAQLDESLPENLQTQLNEIGKALAANSKEIGNLDAIAESYPPLDSVYQKELAALQKEVGERNKGLPPLPLSNEPTKELTNTAIDTFSVNDSVNAAKQPAQQNFRQRIWQLIAGSK